MKEETNFDEISEIEKIFGLRLDRNSLDKTNFRILNMFTTILLIGIVLNVMWLFGMRIGTFKGSYWYIISNFVWFGILYFTYYFSQKFYNEPCFYKKALLQPKDFKIEDLYRILKIAIYPIGYKEIFDEVIKKVYPKEKLEKIVSDDKTILDIYYWIINDTEVKSEINDLIIKEEKIKNKKNTKNEN